MCDHEHEHDTQAHIDRELRKIAFCLICAQCQIVLKVMEIQSYFPDPIGLAILPG